MAQNLFKLSCYLVNLQNVSSRRRNPILAYVLCEKTFAEPFCVTTTPKWFFVAHELQKCLICRTYLHRMQFNAYMYTYIEFIWIHQDWCSSAQSLHVQYMINVHVYLYHKYDSFYTGLDFLTQKCGTAPIFRFY